MIPEAKSLPSPVDCDELRRMCLDQLLAARKERWDVIDAQRDGLELLTGEIQRRLGLPAANAEPFPGHAELIINHMGDAA